MFYFVAITGMLYCQNFGTIWRWVWTDILARQTSSDVIPQAFPSGTRSRCSPSIASVCRDGRFSVCGDLCARKWHRTSANLEQHTFLRMNKQYWAWMDGWLTVAYLREKQTQTVCQNLMLCRLVCVLFCTAGNSFIETSSNFS